MWKMLRRALAPTWYERLWDWVLGRRDRKGRIRVPTPPQEGE